MPGFGWLSGKRVFEQLLALLSGLARRLVRWLGTRRLQPQMLALVAVWPLRGGAAPFQRRRVAPQVRPGGIVHPVTVYSYSTQGKRYVLACLGPICVHFLMTERGTTAPVLKRRRRHPSTCTRVVTETAVQPG